MTQIGMFLPCAPLPKVAKARRLGLLLEALKSHSANDFYQVTVILTFLTFAIAKSEISKF
jgi:hypothetical protein